MLEYLKDKIGGKHTIIQDPQLRLSKKLLKKNSQVKSVKQDDEDTLQIRFTDIHNARCLYRNLRGEKRVIVTIWDIPENDQLAYFVASTLWNDRKADSHLTCSYVTHKHLCVTESHINLEWGVTIQYYENWINNYIDALLCFVQYVDQTREHVKKLPGLDLTLFEKLEVGVGVADAASSIWDVFDI